MGTNYGKPITVSNSDGTKSVEFNAAQGLVVREGTLPVLRVGYGQDRSLGFSFSDESNERIFIGRDSDGSLTFRFSKATFDAQDATGDQLIMSSDFNVPKIVRTGTFTLSAASFVNSGYAYLTKTSSHIIDHADLTAPIVWVFFEDALTDRTLLPYYQFNEATGALLYQAIPKTADTFTTIQVLSTTALSPGVSFRYYILQETASAS